MNVIHLTQYQNETRVDSRVIAEQLGNQHESSMRLIRTYKTDFEELGILRFQIGEIIGRGQPEQFALLNEDQAYLLLTYSRNTKKVRALKVNLVIAFREARYGSAYKVLAARKEEASKCGRGLAQWRYDKSVVYERVAYLREQLKLPIDLEGV
ncbi:Rha family transcriptional regulator [Pseudomonas sp. NCHU5208]|uniref:Rha family transcriptional regulator n=1 Tax=unclassified Pseudomonas TaxID=196821 RepID=UPI003F982E25